MAISRDQVDEIKSRVSIIDVAAERVNLSRHGSTMSCCCPFHQEKTPSCVLYEKTNSFYCFGCGTSGDVISFIRGTDNLSYVEAVQQLAQRAGITIDAKGAQLNQREQELRDRKRAKVALCGGERNIMTEIIYAKPQYKQSRMLGKELCWRVPEDMPLKNEKWALVPCKEHLYLVEILRKEWVEDNIAEQYRRVYAIGSTREELKPPIGRVHLIDADRIDMPGEVSYHAVENSKLSKPDVMELLQYPIGVTLEADGRYRVFLGAYRVWYLRECLHWTKIPCYVYKIKRQIRDPRERRRREIHRRQQAAESPRIRLQLYENYYKLLKGMKDAGEIKGGLQTRLMQLLGVSERTVRIYKQLSEQLTGREKQHLMRGKLPFVQARAVAAERNQKAAMLPDFEEVEDNKDKNLPANNGE